MDDAATPREPAPLSPGRRIRFWRERRGMTREILGGLVGKSASWVKAVETDRSRCWSYYRTAPL
jgi:transcriptional regulator with XRE-family HTH domain